MKTEKFSKGSEQENDMASFGGISHFSCSSSLPDLGQPAPSLQNRHLNSLENLPNNRATRTFRLSDPRLLAAAGMVRFGSVAADIGADHGYLICHLVREGISPKGFACDINAGPLAACANTVAEQGLEDKITLLQTNGLCGLPLEKVDDIIIAGMGGELIADILAASPAAQDKRLRFILQPMTKSNRLRCALYQMGYALEREIAVRAGGNLYTVMRAVFTGQSVKVNKLFALVGLLPEEGTPESRELLAQTALRLKKAAEGLMQSKTPRGIKKAANYQRLAAEIEKRN